MKSVQSLIVFTVIRRGKSIETVGLQEQPMRIWLKWWLDVPYPLKTAKQAAQPKECGLVYQRPRCQWKPWRTSEEPFFGCSCWWKCRYCGYWRKWSVRTNSSYHRRSSKKVESGRHWFERRKVSCVGIHPRTSDYSEMKCRPRSEDRHRDGLILDVMISENFAHQTYYKEPLDTKKWYLELCQYYFSC